MKAGATLVQPIWVKLSGDQIINLNAVSRASFINGTLTVIFIDSSISTFTSDAAIQLWGVLQSFAS